MRVPKCTHPRKGPRIKNCEWDRCLSGAPSKMTLTNIYIVDTWIPHPRHTWRSLQPVVGAPTNIVGKCNQVIARHAAHKRISTGYKTHTPLNINPQRRTSGAAPLRPITRRQSDWINVKAVHIYAERAERAPVRTPLTTMYVKNWQSWIQRQVAKL